MRHYRLTERLIHQGYRYSDLCRAFRKFFIRHIEIINKYNIGIHKHIEDGICLPAMNSVLSRHVSHMLLNLIIIYIIVNLPLFYNYSSIAYFIL